MQNFAPAIYRMAWVHKNNDKYSDEPVKELLLKATMLGNVRAQRDLGLYLIFTDKKFFSSIVGLKHLFLSIINTISVAIVDTNDTRLLY